MRLHSPGLFALLVVDGLLVWGFTAMLLSTVLDLAGPAAHGVGVSRAGLGGEEEVEVPAGDGVRKTTLEALTAAHPGREHAHARRGDIHPWSEVRESSLPIASHSLCQWQLHSAR